MKALKTFWGLVVDDGRLAWILVIGLLISAVVSLAFNLPLIGSMVIWLSLILALIVSVEHQLRLKVKGK